MRALLAALAVAVLLAVAGGQDAARAASPFADWAGVVVAGDFRAHSGSDTETFDNARRDLHHALVSAGFSPQNLLQFSVRPDRYPAERLVRSDVDLIRRRLADLAAKARGGCLVYFTTHGSPDGVVVGESLLSPAGLSRIVDRACGDRPTVVVVSACFSGVFVEPLSRPERMVLTAAQSDRSSFGCGESDRYPYFDACVLETLPHATDLGVLGREVQACVARKEKDTGMTPPSEPQLFIGSQFRPLVPFYPLRVRPASALEPAGSGPAP